MGLRVRVGELQDVPPQGAVVTDYDRRHMTQYMRLLDAAGEGASWRQTPCPAPQLTSRYTFAFQTWSTSVH